MRKNVVIVAGGSGQRMNNKVPKQFILLAGMPILVHTIHAFYAYDPEIRIVLVLARNLRRTWENLAAEYMDPAIKIRYAEGGSTRFESVRSGLASVKDGLVAIHDAVRPFVTRDIIHASFVSAEHTGSGVAMVPLKDSIRERIGTQTEARDRHRYFAVQTPQTFQLELIKRAFARAVHSDFTDDASVYEAAGNQVTVVEGDPTNIKITTPGDLIMAEALMAHHKKSLG